MRAERITAPCPLAVPRLQSRRSFRSTAGISPRHHRPGWPTAPTRAPPRRVRPPAIPPQWENRKEHLTMQTWAKRGLQTALVTGGLLMLGTGIASADEDVNPDRPASPIDGSIGVPVHLQNNAVGTPLGSRTLPDVHRDATIRPSDVTTALPTGKVTPVTDAAVTK